MARVREFVWDYPKEKGLPYTDEDAANFLRQRGILPEEHLCSTGHQMMLFTGAETYWECIKRLCRKKKPVFIGDHMVGRQTSLVAVLRFVHSWCAEPMLAYESAARLNMHERTASEWRNFLRRTCLGEILSRSRDAKIGGRGLLVEIDESIYKRPSLQHERVTAGPFHQWKQWITGGICRATDEAFAVDIAERSPATLLSALREHVADGSVIYLHPGHGYSIEDLKEAGLEVLITSRGYRFLEYPGEVPENTEPMAWGSARWRKMQHRDTELHHLESYFVEFMWLLKTNNPFDEMLEILRKQCLEKRPQVAATVGVSAARENGGDGAESPRAAADSPGGLQAPASKARSTKRGRRKRRTSSGSSDDEQPAFRDDAVPEDGEVEPDAIFDEVIGQMDACIQPSRKGETFYYCSWCKMNARLNKNGSKTVRSHMHTQRHLRYAEAGGRSKKRSRRHSPAEREERQRWPARVNSQRQRKEGSAGKNDAQLREGDLFVDGCENDDRERPFLHMAVKIEDELPEKTPLPQSPPSSDTKLPRRCAEDRSTFTVKQELPDADDDDADDEPSCSGAFEPAEYLEPGGLLYNALQCNYDSLRVEGVPAIEALRGVSLERLQEYIRMPDVEFLEWLTDLRLIAAQPICDCGRPMVRRNRPRDKERPYRPWRCGCGKVVEFFRGSVFQCTKLTPKEAVMLAWHWTRSECSNKEARQLMQRAGGVSPNPVDWVRLFREVCSYSLRTGDYRIGGAGKVVLVEECFFLKRRAGAGEIWVLGGVDCDDGKECFVRAWTHRDAATLSAIIEKFVRPGSTVVCGLWAAYGRAQLTGDYELAMPSDLPSVGVAAADAARGKSALDALWRRFKRVYNIASSARNFDTHVDEFMWRMRFDGPDCFYHLWSHVANMFRV